MRSIWWSPLPHQRASAANRILLRIALTLLRRRLVAVEGLWRLAPEHDPFVLALNHSERREAVLLPALFAWSRLGKQIHFLADWNFLLIPGVSGLLRRGEIIPVCRKPARPRILTRLRPFLVRGPHGLGAARARLSNGGSIGVFPEGTVNPDDTCVLAGCHGAVRLAVELGVPVIPVGVRYLGASDPRSHGRLMAVRVGEPLSWRGMTPTRGVVREAHAVLMESIATLSHRTWKPNQRRRSHV